MAAETMVAEGTSQDTRIDEMLGLKVDKTITADSMEDAERGDDAEGDHSKEAAPAEEIKKPEPGSDMETRYKNLQYAHSKQANEIGQMRAQLKAMMDAQNALKADEKKDDRKFLDRFVENPEQALEAELSKRESARRAQEDAVHTMTKQNMDQMYTVVPELDDLADTILNLAHEDMKKMAELRGQPEPPKPTRKDLDYTIANDFPLALQFAQRAKDRHALTRNSDKGKKVVEQMARGSRTQTAVTGNSGQSGAKTRLTPKDLSNMSDADLAKLLQEHRRG